MSDKKLISVVIPCYNEEPGIDELCTRLRKVFDANAHYDFEAVLVENGSADGTFGKMMENRRKDARFKILRLARNFQMEGGITAGLRHARGDAAVIMTADLQDPPEMITQFIKKWEEGYEDVYGIVTKRVGTGIVRKINSQIFYFLLNWLTDGLFPRNASDFRLVDRKIYQVVNSMPERNRFMRGMFMWVGFKSVGIEHERAPRFAGEAKSITSHVVQLAIKGILAYSYIPLRAITIIGISVSAFAFSLLIFIVVKVLVKGVPFPGFGTLTGAVLLMFGVLTMMLGIISEYLGLIYEEVKQRPNFIVREAVGWDERGS